MKKKITALLLVLCIVLCSLQAFAAINEHTPGKVSWQVPLSDAFNASDAEVKDNILHMNANGSILVDVLFEEDSEKADVTYSAESPVTLTFTSNGETFSANLEAGSDVSQSIPMILRQGSQLIEISSDAPVTISDITISKMPKGAPTWSNYIVDYTPYEEAFQTTVVVDINSVAIKVDNAMRYINYDDVSETPLVADGRVYLPAKTIARAFSMYYEDYPELSYVFLSNDNIEIYAGTKDSYSIKNGIKNPLESFIVYRDGKAYVPVRQLAELVGLTVDYKDGYVIIDERVCVKNIMKNDTLFEELKNEFEKYKLANAKGGNVYHVAKTPIASDDNIGNEYFPYATISKAAEVAKAGDTVIIHEGIYRETVTPENDGTATDPIIFKAAEGENVVISAFDEVSGFIPYDTAKNIWQTTVEKSMGFDRNFIIMNDEIIKEGCHPNSDTNTTGLTPHPDYDSVMRPVMGDIRMPDKGEYAVSDVDLNQTEKDYWKGGTYTTLTGWGWTLSYAKITESEKGKIIVQDYEEPRVYGINYYVQGSRRPHEYGFITNHINTVDMPGEWFVDTDNILYMIPPEGVDGKSLSVEFKQRQLVIDLRNRKYVQFVDINTRGGGLTMAGDTEMNVLNGGTHKYISHFGYSGGRDTHSLRFYDIANRKTGKDDAPEFGEVGFFAHGANNAFINADIEYSAGAGIYLTGKYAYVDNNIVAHTAYAGTYPSGITVEGSHAGDPKSVCGGHSIIGNTSYGSGRACIYVSRNTIPNVTPVTSYPMVASDISYNYLHHGNVVSHDTGNFYTYGTTLGNDRRRTEVHHNISHDLVTDPVDSKLHMNFYFDGHTSMVNAYSNIAFSKYEKYFPQTKYAYYYYGGDAMAQVDDWGNKNLGIFTEGIEGMEIADYPYSKPFSVGAVRDGDERFMLNYNKASDSSVTLACEAEIANGAYMSEDGFVALPEENSSITFPSLNFADSGNKLSLYFASDVYKATSETLDTVTVEILKNGEVIRKVERLNFYYDGKLDSISTMDVLLPPEINGEADVRISVSDGNVRMAKVAVTPCDYDIENSRGTVSASADIIYMGSFDEYIQGTSRNKPVTKMNIGARYAETYQSYSVSQTDDHTYVFKDRYISKDATKLSMRIGTAQYWGNVKIKIYVDDPNSEPIGELDVLEPYRKEALPRIWITYDRDIELKRTLPAGKHTFYVRYEGYVPEDVECEAGYGITDTYYLAWD